MTRLQPWRRWGDLQKGLAFDATGHGGVCHRARRGAASVFGELTMEYWQTMRCWQRSCARWRRVFWCVLLAWALTLVGAMLLVLGG